MARTKAFLSCGNYFRVNSSRKNSIVLTTNTPPTWPPCHVVASHEYDDTHNTISLNQPEMSLPLNDEVF